MSELDHVHAVFNTILYDGWLVNTDAKAIVDTLKNSSSEETDKAANAQFNYVMSKAVKRIFGFWLNAFSDCGVDIFW